MCLTHRFSINGSTKRGKESLHLMETVNAKKRWATINWRVKKFMKESRKVTRLAKEREPLLIITTLMIFHFWNGRLPSLLFYSVSEEEEC
jgi:hypothetical protein